MAKLLPVKIPPGMFRNGTNYEAAGRWWDGNLVRWENGRLKPMGGWQSLLSAGVHLTGVARGGLAWADDGGFKHIAIGTNSKLYIGSGGTFADVTPGGLVAGRVDSILGPGYGAGPYSGGHYGTQRTGSAIALDAATWSFDTLGQLLLGVLTSDQKIYEYDVVTGLVTVPTGSPTAQAIMVTNEDYILAIGAGGKGRKIQWPDIGTDNVWTPASTNSAGSINLNTGGRGMCGTRVGLQNIVWTNSDVHLINFVGPPGIYGPIRIAENCGIVGPNAFAVQDFVEWWSPGGFFRYNGIVQPLQCPVQDFIFKNVNQLQFAKIYGETNSRFSEFTWFFPSLNSTECDSYVTHNIKDDIWYFGIGGLPRTTWIDRGTFPLPIAVDPSGVVYEHETGYLANGVSRVGQVFATSGPVQVGDGDNVIYANLVIPDVDPNPSAVQMTALCQQAPEGPVTAVGPVSLMPNAEGYAPVRFGGRQVALKIEATADQDWSFGTMRVRVAGGGGR